MGSPKPIHSRSPPGVESRPEGTFPAGRRDLKGGPGRAVAQAQVQYPEGKPRKFTPVPLLTKDWGVSSLLNGPLKFCLTH